MTAPKTRKKIKLLKTTSWWDAGSQVMAVAEDERHLYFYNEEGKYCAIAKSDVGSEYEELPPSADQLYYAEKAEDVRQQKKAYRRELKQEVVRQLGGRCRNCGYSEHFQALDVQGGSGRGTKGYTSYYNQVLKVLQISPAMHSFYLLCANCQRLEEK